MSTNSAQTAGVVRKEVSRMLGNSAAFRRLGPSEQASILENTTRVVAAMAAERDRHGKGTFAPSHRTSDPWAKSLADEERVDGDSPSTPAKQGRWRPDDRFEAEATNAGTRAAGNMLREVNFPAFVSSLVQGVFQSIVDASIQQMKAYGELVQSVALSLNEFRDANVDEGQGAAELVRRYPRHFKLNESESGAVRVAVRDDANLDELPNFQSDLGLPDPVTDLDDEVLQKTLVVAARTQVAMGRQKLLATTLLMGINRIIVTDGKINAKVTFDFKAKDSFKRDGVINDIEDRVTKRRNIERRFSDRLVRGSEQEMAQVTVASTTGHTEGNIDANATLKGEVSINFRSETFPLERLANSDQVTRINAAQGGESAPAPRPAAAPAAAPPSGAPAPAPAPSAAPPR